LPILILKAPVHIIQYTRMYTRPYTSYRHGSLHTQTALERGMLLQHLRLTDSINLENNSSQVGIIVMNVFTVTKV